jgi:molybdenum cofactor synthesis domain-containing protein
MVIMKQQPINYKQALNLTLQEAEKLSIESEFVSLPDSVDRVLACDIKADSDRPSCANSAMDGFCVNSSDLQQAGPENKLCLPAVKGIDAGNKLSELPPGHCAYIATGAPLPAKADAVVRIEDVEGSYESEKVIFKNTVKAGNFVRKKGAEQQKGKIIAPLGTIIDPFVVGIAASAGQTMIQVKKKPRVAVLTSGDELIMPWDNPHPWQVRNGNSPMLCAQINQAGGQAFDIGIARDDEAHAKRLFLQAVNSCDIVVTSGGISMGRKDPFRNLFGELNIKPLVYGVTMKPGKPFFFGYYDNKPIFALPGNQVSTAVTCELFVRSFIRKALGLPCHRRRLSLRLKIESCNPSRRDFFQRAKIVRENDELIVMPLARQQSHMLSSFTQTDALYIHPAHQPILAAGTRVECLMLKNES